MAAVATITNVPGLLEKICVARDEGIYIYIYVVLVLAVVVWLGADDL